VSAEELGKLADFYGVSVHMAVGKGEQRCQRLAAQVLANMSDAQLDRLSAAIKIVRERRSPLLNMPGGR